jgi:hypothetical protein
MTGADGSPQHFAFLQRRTAEILENAPTETVMKAWQQGYQDQPPALPQARGRVVSRHPNGSVEIDLGDDSPEQLIYGNGTAEQRGPETAANFDKTGRLYGDVTLHPGYRAEQERRARVEQHQRSGGGSYVVGGKSLDSSRDFVPADGRDPHGRYGDSRKYPYRDPWRSGR